MRRNSTIGICLIVAMLAGCSTTGPFGREKLVLPVGPSYIGGRGMQVFPGSDALVGNIKEAMSDVGMHAIVQTQDPGGLLILEATTADNRKARVTILGTGTRATVSAKVGWLGDEPITRALLDRIGTRQGTIVPSPGEVPAEETPTGRFSRDAVPDSTMLRNQLDAGYNSSNNP